MFLGGFALKHPGDGFGNQKRGGGQGDGRYSVAAVWWRIVVKSQQE
jgi:hypothetical protein